MALGNISAGSLVKSANSIASTVAAYQDSIQAYQWAQSSQTSADFQAYTNYLTGRIGTLQQSSTISNQSKALSLTKALSSAQSSYSSNEIQRATMSVVNGTGTNVDKYQTIAKLYDQAVATGDMNLAQNLEATANNLSVQIQYQQQVAATAQEHLDTVNAAAIAGGDATAINGIKSAIALLDTGLSQNGPAQETSTLKQISDSLAPLYKAMGVTLPKGAQLTIGSLAQGALEAQAHLYGLAAQATAITDPQSSATYAGKQQDIQNNVATVKVGGVNMTLTDATNYAQHPDAYYFGLGSNNGYTLKQSVVDGYTYDAQGNVQPIYSPSGAYTTNAADVNKNKTQVIADLTKAGLTNVKVNADGTIEGTPSTSSSLFTNYINSNGLPKNTPLRIVQNAAGYQIEPSFGADGTQRLLVLSKDNSGNLGLYQQTFDQTNQGSHLNLVGQNGGFNPLVNSATLANPNEGVGAQLATLLKNYTTKGNGYTEKTVIPQIAQQYFNGDTKAAATAVYQFRKPLEPTTQVTSNNAAFNVNSLLLRPSNAYVNPLVPAPAHQLLGVPATPAGKKQNAPSAPNLPQAAPRPQLMGVPALKTNAPAPRAPAPVQQRAPAPVAPAPAQRPQLAGIPSLGGGGNNLNSALSQSFANFGSRANGYTESTILPSIAKQFYGGNIQAASTSVYQYRMANFNQ